MEELVRSPLPARRKPMAYMAAGIDVHKKVLMVVVGDASVPDWSLRAAGLGPWQANWNCWRSG